MDILTILVLELFTVKLGILSSLLSNGKCFFEVGQLLTLFIKLLSGLLKLVLESINLILLDLYLLDNEAVINRWRATFFFLLLLFTKFCEATIRKVNVFDSVVKFFVAQIDLLLDVLDLFLHLFNLFHGLIHLHLKTHLLHFFVCRYFTSHLNYFGR